MIVDERPRPTAAFVAGGHCIVAGYSSRTVRRLIALALLGLASAAGGCGKSGGQTQVMDAGDDGIEFAACLQVHQDKGVMPYAAGVSDPSSKGSFTATLVSSRPGYPEDNRPPGPEVKGVNTWSVSITDGSGAPVDGLTVDASPYMPDHRHGTTVTSVTTAQGGGSYQIAPLYLYMTGYWEVTLNITPPPTDGGAPVTETVMFNLCIP
jgi:hypothetical protein